MRILQIIDSLDAGGAERMAVNYANGLVNVVEFSGLVATRKEGLLLDQIHPSVSYLFLRKKSRLDISAVLRLRSYVLKNKVTHIHAHSTSFFLAFLLKITLPSLKIIRHDHYGNNEFLEDRPYSVLKLTAFLFDGAITVNQNLKEWSEKVLKAKNVIYLPNFAGKDINVEKNTVLKGFKGKRIVCLANLRPQKDHFLLLEVAEKLKVSYPEWTFHLVGKDFEDEYSNLIKESIRKKELENSVFIYNSRRDIFNILNQADIAVLTSKSEGFPVALLEYGQSKKPVVVTNVGEVPFIIKHHYNGLLVSNSNAETFCEAIVECIENIDFRFSLGNQLANTISENFSEKAVIKKYLKWMHLS